MACRTSGHDGAIKSCECQNTTLSGRAPQLEKDFHGNGDRGKAGQNDHLRLSPRSFDSKLMDLDCLKVSHFQLNLGIIDTKNER